MATYATRSSHEHEFVRDGSLGTASGELLFGELDRNLSETMSNSFDLVTDISPHTQPLMDFNSSDGALSEQNFGFDSFVVPDPFTQMSRGLLEEDNFAQNYIMQNSEQFFPGSSGSFAQQSNINQMMNFGQQAQSFPAQFSQSARHHGQVNPNSLNFQGQQWINGPVNIKYEAQEDDSISPSTIQHQSFQGVPWTPEGPARYPGSAQPHHQGWGLSATSTTLNTTFPSYAGSVLSSAHDSSPMIDGLTTPDSATRSPMFSTRAPISSAGSSSGGDNNRQVYPSYEQNSRSIPMNNFQQQNNYLTPHNVSPQNLMIDTSAMNQLHRDPTHSPLSSDFVMVDKSDAGSSIHAVEDRRQSQPKQQKKQAPRRSRVASNPKRIDPDNFVSEYPSHATGPIRRQSSSAAKAAKADSRRVGGRSLGMHLTEEAAARAKQLRDEGSCWICCFQRDSCSPGPECDRCQKRHLRSQMEHGLGCDRTKLNDLRPYFIPDFLARSGDKKTLSEFMDNHIRRWDSRPLRLRVNIVWGQVPMELELYEFEPKTSELSRHLQSVVDKNTGKRRWENKGSPPLAMVQIDSVDRRAYEKYIDDIVDNEHNLENFVDRCYRFENDNFQRRLFRLMYEYNPTNSNEKLLMKEIMRLQVITYIYCRASTIVNDDLHLLNNLQYSIQNNGIQYKKATTIRLANRQLKYLYTSLWKQIMESVLKRLQQVLRSSSGGSKWSSGFVAVLGLGMAFESIQLMSHAHQEADELMGNTTSWVGKERAETACRVIDEKFFFLTTLFRWKYHRGFNPFKNIHDREMHKTLGPQALELVQGVNELVAEKSEYLNFREQVAILSDNKEKYTSRLVAKFLMGFWKPSA